MAAARPTTGTMIETHDLARTFKARKTVVEAVRGVDLQVGAGEIFGFLGPNGAGKTTTLRMLATLLTPTSGDGDGRRGRPRARAPDGPGADRLRPAGRLDRPVRDRPRRARHPGPPLRDERERGEGPRGARSSKALDLESAADRTTSTYSGGMKRRLDVGLGIVHRPAVLFLDEPTTGLDPQARARMWEEIRNLRALGTTVFLTTHYLEEADALADRLAIIDQGKIVAEGTADELKRQVAGDVITVGVNGATERVLETVRLQPFVREASGEDGLVRLYVDRGEEAMPQILRLLDGAGLAPVVDRPPPPQPRRRLPHPDRPLASRRSRPPDPQHATKGTHRHEARPRHLAHLPPVARPDDPPADLDRVRDDGPGPLPGPVRAAARGCHRRRRRHGQRVQLVRARA